MSHVVEIRTQVKDAAAVEAACRRLGWPPPTQGTAQLYASSASGLIVTLPQWRYPVVFQLASGEAQYDNYGGAWGEQAQLDRLLQAYAVEKAALEARRRGYRVREQALPSGAIKLTLELGGGA